MLLSHLIKQRSIIPRFLPQTSVSSLRYVPRSYFSESDPNKDKDKSQSSEGVISLSDIWDSISNAGQRIYNNAKKLNRINWALLASLPIIYLLSKK